jgi:2-polyprenyl-3-methyl-5-hydroxy-6-metoxy-1,4-benzoquinol methylase
MRMHPWPKSNELSQYYPESYWFAPQQNSVGRLEETYRRFVLSDHVRFVAKAVRPSDGPVLDVGCGGALFGRLLRERGYRVYGLDYSTQAAHVGWSQNGVPITAGSFSSAPFAGGTFAGITMFHVLEHLYDPGAYIEAAWHLLKSGGRLIVQVPNAASWQSLLFREHWNGFDLPRHLIDFRSSDIHSLVSQKGFNVLRTKHFSLRDNPAGFASSVAPGLDPMARRVRGKTESTAGRMARNLAYFGFVLSALPFAALEAACCAGSTVMLDARKSE